MITLVQMHNSLGNALKIHEWAKAKSWKYNAGHKVERWKNKRSADKTSGAQRTQTHKQSREASAENTGLGRCWKYWLGQSLKILDWASAENTCKATHSNTCGKRIWQLENNGGQKVKIQWRAKAGNTMAGLAGALFITIPHRFHMVYLQPTASQNPFPMVCLQKVGWKSDLLLCCLLCCS